MRQGKVEENKGRGREVKESRGTNRESDRGGTYKVIVGPHTKAFGARKITKTPKTKKTDFQFFKISTKFSHFKISGLFKT